MGLMLLRSLNSADLPVEQKYVIKKEIKLGPKINSLKAHVYLLKQSGFKWYIFKVLFKQNNSALAYDKICSHANFLKENRRQTKMLLVQSKEHIIYVLKPKLVLKSLQSLKHRTKTACSSPNLPPALRIFCRILCPFGSPPDRPLYTADSIQACLL